MPNYAPRVSVCYADMSGVVHDWSETCEKMVVYQHDADAEVPRTHLHFLIVNCKHKSPEALKRKFHSRVETDLVANELWAWTHKDYPNPDEGFIPYMTKGNLAPVFVKNFSPDELEAARAKWIEPIPKGKCLLTDEKEDTKKPKKKTRRELVDIISARYKALEQKHELFEKIADQITKIVIEVLNEEKAIFRRSKVQEYRDTVMGEHHKLKFLNFANEDIYKYVKYNG